MTKNMVHRTSEIAFSSLARFRNLESKTWPRVERSSDEIYYCIKRLNYIFILTVNKTRHSITMLNSCRQV